MQNVNMVLNALVRKLAGKCSHHSDLEGVKNQKKLFGPNFNAKNYQKTSLFTTKFFKIGQRGLSE